VDSTRTNRDRERRANKMERISDEFLVESFIQAKKMGLDLDFISLLEEEIKLRKLNIDDYQDAMNCINNK